MCGPGCWLNLWKPGQSQGLSQHWCPLGPRGKSWSHWVMKRVPLILSPMSTYSWSSRHHHHGDRENHAVGFPVQGRMHISTPITSPDNEWSCEQTFHSPRLSDIIAKVSAHCIHLSSIALAMGLPIISWTPKKTQVHKKGQSSHCLQSCKGEHQESIPLRNRLLQDPI